VGAKSSFPLITFSNPQMAVGTLQVNDSEEATSLDTIKQIIDKREWIPIFLRDSIKPTEVYAKSNISGLFLDK
jgi:hypothetical protein